MGFRDREPSDDLHEYLANNAAELLATEPEGMHPDEYAALEETVQELFAHGFLPTNIVKDIDSLRTHLIARLIASEQDILDTLATKAGLDEESTDRFALLREQYRDEMTILAESRFKPSSKLLSIDPVTGEPLVTTTNPIPQDLYDAVTDVAKRASARWGSELFDTPNED